MDQYMISVMEDVVLYLKSKDPLIDVTAKELYDNNDILNKLKKHSSSMKDDIISSQSNVETNVYL